MEPLRGLFARDHAELAAFTPSGPATLGDLARLSEGVARLAPQQGRWILACEDPLRFAAGLLGLAQAGCSVVLPPNLLPETLKAMGHAKGVLRDGDVQPAPVATREPIRDTLLEFWTSGSTGAPKRVQRRFSAVVQEIPILEAILGHRSPRGLVMGTVPHHHFYGLLFRILWPLGTGRPFATETCGDPDRYAAALAQGSAPILISSPAHLGRLPELVDLDHFKVHPAAIFSSGGPLRREDALRWHRWVPSGIIEIYGSTESGGVAWRNPGLDHDSEWWTPFSDTQVSLDPDGALHLHSPRLEVGEMRLEDAALLGPEGRFQLQGRLDRVVKVEEKRVSLVELEAALEAHPAVQRAAVTLLQGPRRLLGAALVLTPGQDTSSPEARRQLGQRLRNHLAQRFDPVVLPRRWRFVAHLPFDARGKLRAQDVAALFEACEEVLP